MLFTALLSVRRLAIQPAAGMSSEGALWVPDLTVSALSLTSLDAPLGDDDSSPLADVVPATDTLDPYEDLEQRTVQEMVRQFLPILQPRELSILQERFGLEGGPEKTLDEIGQRFGVTRERIRQLQNLALAKLRAKIEAFEAVQVPA